MVHKNNAEHQRTWYQANKQKKSEQVARYNVGFEKRNREYVDALKLITPCADCGNSYPPVCMDYHHLGGKKRTVASMIRKNSIKVIQEEIDKCVLLCANCHRLRHYG